MSFDEIYPDDFSENWVRMRPVVTGFGWLGGGIRSIDAAVEEAIAGSQFELLIAAYAISDGADHFLKMLEACMCRGVRVVMIVNRVESQYGRVPDRMRELVAAYPEFALFTFMGGEESEFLHAKAVVADRKLGVIGSANLSFNGLVNNHELAVVLDGPGVAHLAECIDKLVTLPQVERFRC